MKTTIQIKSPQGSVVSITVEHDEPMELNTDHVDITVPQKYPNQPIELAKKLGFNVIGDKPDQKKDRISRSPINCANPNCQQPFVRKSNRQKYCSRKCRNKHESLIASSSTAKDDRVLDRPITKRCLKCNLNFTTYNARELHCEMCRLPKTTD